MRAPLLLALLVTPLTGCLVTGALDPGGGGRVTVRMRLVSVQNFEVLKTALQSPDVTVKNASLTPKKWATYELEFRDIRRLWTAPALARVSAAVSDHDGERTMAVTMSNPVPEQMSDAFQRYAGNDLKISIELPGDVLDSNATSTSGRTVAWTWSYAEASARPTTDLTATFRVPPPQ